jgi:hypothetical protein
MSDHGELSYSTAEGMDYPAHEATYKSFIKIGTVGAGIAATVIALLGFSLPDCPDFVPNFRLRYSTRL